MTPATPRRIEVATGTGTGPTPLAAFDAALMEAGVADRNLIYLSSIIPPGSAVQSVDRVDDPPGDWGDRLYVVMAEQRETTPGVEASAGIGWAQQEGGRGLFVEHYGQSRAQVERNISASLDALAASRDMAFGPITTEVANILCDDHPVCALAVAVLGGESW